MPTFNADLPDGLSRRTMPTEAIVGRLQAETTVTEFVSVMATAGIDDSRIHIFTGSQGADVIGDLGTPIGRFFSADRHEPIELLRSGATLVAVLGVSDEDQGQVASAVNDAGAKVMHRFGKWTYS